MREEIKEQLRRYIEASADPYDALNEVRAMLHELSPGATEPIDYVRWVPHEQVTPNDYNPNSVARHEMDLLYTSIRHDGYTQPVVTIFDPAAQRYIIVDGFHRYYTMKARRDIYERCGGRLPIVVIPGTPSDRRSWDNCISDLRKAGFVWKGR